MGNILMGNTHEFAEVLEDWIILNKCNPTTREEWERCIKDLQVKGALTIQGSIADEDTKKFKKELKDNFNTKEF